MHRIYSAANLAEAYLIVGMLAGEGIAARVFNENAQGGVGEIPFTHAWPEVWIADEADVERALQIVRKMESPDLNHQISCEVCGESNPETFELCWNCGGNCG